MVTTVIKTVGLGGSRNYTSLVSWDIARRGVLPTGGVDGIPGGVIEVAEVYGGGSVGALKLGVGWVTSSTCYPWIRAAAGEGHTGTFDINKAYMTTGSATELFWTDYSYTRLGPGLCMDDNRNTGTTSGVVFANPSYGHVCEGNIIRSTGTNYSYLVATGNSTPSEVFTLKNCIVMDQTSHSENSVGPRLEPMIAFYFNCTAKVYNNTFYMGATYAADVILSRSGGTSTIYSDNNYYNPKAYPGDGIHYSKAYGTAGITKGAGDATSTTEATTASLRSIPYTTATFFNVTAGSENLRPVVSASNKLLDNGTNLTSEGVTTDIIGTARPQFGGFDIGAFENDVPICWNYTARYKGSNKLFKASGCGNYPRSLRVPSNIDKGTGRMIDDGVEIDPSEYTIL